MKEESRVKNNNFYVVSGWMINELGLTGRELELYAIIYGFSQERGNEFKGTNGYIAGWLGIKNKMTVIRTVNALLEKGFIEKRQEEFNGKVQNFYRALTPDDIKERIKCQSQNVTPPVTKCYPTGNKMLPHQSQNVTHTGNKMLPNIYIDKDKDKDIYKYSELWKKKDDLSGKIKEYSDGCQSLEDALAAYVEMRKKIKKPMTGYALKLAFNKLDRLAGTADKKVAIVNQSIMNGWQGLFPVKEEAENGRKSAEDYRGIHGLPELDTDISRYRNIKF